MTLKINITVDLDDFLGGWGSDDLNEMVRDEIKKEVMTQVKKTPEYKKHVAHLKEEALAKIASAL